MRAFLSRRSVMLAAGLTLAAFTGCKSGFNMPGANWLSWSKKPAPTTLAANTFPQKPSANALPNPTATTNAQAGYPGYGTNGYASNQAGSATGYNTGPYSTAGLNTAAAAANRARMASNPYSSTTPAQSAAPYQSPYSTPGAGSGNSSPYTATADRRNSYANSYSSSNGSSYATSPSNNGYGQYGANDPYAGQNQGSYPSTGAASYPQTQSYGAATPSYPATTSAPATGYSPATTYGSTGNSSTADTSSATGQTGGGSPYRPGSTARNAGQFPPGSSAVPAATGYQGSSYPSTATPSSYTYPSTGSNTR